MTPEETRRLRRLRGVTGAAVDAARQTLRAATAKRAAVEDRIAALDRDRAAVATETGWSPARSAGAGLAWMKWAERQRAALNRELAAARAQEARAKSELALTFRRNDALDKVIRKRAGR